LFNVFRYLKIAHWNWKLHLSPWARENSFRNLCSYSGLRFLWPNSTNQGGLQGQPATNGGKQHLSLFSTPEPKLKKVKLTKKVKK